MRVFGFATIALFCLAAISHAAPADPKLVSADAAWAAHLDVDAMRQSPIVIGVYKYLSEKIPNAEEHFAKVHEHLGMDPRKDLHDITVYGAKVGDPNGILIVRADVDQKLLIEKAKKAPDAKSSTYGAYELYSFTSKQHGQPHSVTGAFWKENAIVFGSGEDAVKKALDVLDGKQPSLEGKASPLVEPLPAGSIFVARATNIDAAACKSALVKQCESLSIVMGQNGDQSFFSGKLVTKDAATVQELKTVLDGFAAMGRLQNAGDAAAMKLLEAVKVTVTDKTIQVDASAPSADVLTHLGKVAKKVEAMHKAHHKPGPKPEKK